MSKDPRDELGLVVAFLTATFVFVMWLLIGGIQRESADASCRVGYILADEGQVYHVDTLAFELLPWPVSNTAKCRELVER